MGQALNIVDGVPETAKEIIEVIDDDKYLTTYKVIEGHLLERFKSFVITIQATPKGADGEGCIVHWTLEYEKLNADIEDPHTLLDLATAVTKHLEDHFLDQA